MREAITEVKTPMLTRGGAGFEISPAPARSGSSTPRFRRKRTRTTNSGVDFFDNLPDDLLLLIFSNLATTAGSPPDLINPLLTCRRFNKLGTNANVLANVSANGIAVTATAWSESAHRFLSRCADAGSIEACFTLGMIRFYCLENRGSGASLIAKAAMGSHPEALYSLAVIHFNGSGGSKNEKDLRAGVALCARAACFGHVSALRELGHCLQDGYGVRRNVADGRRFLVQANAREISVAVGKGLLMLGGFGSGFVAAEWCPANRFMAEWFGGRGREDGGEELKMCSNRGCGRKETRRHEFRRCSVCGTVNYCSRACQAVDWKVEHKVECGLRDGWGDGGGA